MVRKSTRIRRSTTCGPLKLAQEPGQEPGRVRGEGNKLGQGQGQGQVREPGQSYRRECT